MGNEKCWVSPEVLFPLPLGDGPALAPPRGAMRRVVLPLPPRPPPASWEPAA